MKVILRNVSTDLYFLGPNMWTNDPGKALDFGRTDRAVELARGTGIGSLELILSFRGIPQEIHLALDKINQDSLAAQAIS